MTTFLLFILLIIIAVGAFMIIKKNEMELGSKTEDILLEQARVLELQAELEQAELREQKQLDALRVEMQILERENAKNVLTLEKELAAAGLKGKAVQDALRKEMEESREIEQAKIESLQSQLNKTRAQEREKVKSLQYELDKSQARMSVMETNVEKLRATSSKERGLSDAQIAELKKKLSEAKAESQTLQDEMKKKKEERTKASEELKTLQSELDELKKSEAEKLSTLQKKLGDSETTIEDLEDEIEELKNRAAEMVKSPDAGTQPSIVPDRNLVSPPPPAPASSCKYEPFNPSKNYPGTHHDNYVKYCNDLISGDCAEELCKNTGAKNACSAECEAVMARPPPSSSPPTDGYVDNGLGFCKSGQIYASPGWALLNPGEPKNFASSFDDPVYKEYAKRGQAKCDADPNCKYVTVWRNAGYRMYNANAGSCSDKHDASGSNKSWKKTGKGGAGGSAPPPPKLPPAPMTGYLDNGLGFCKSGQIYASPAWALLNPGEPRKMASSFSDPLYREYAKRAHNKCNADPNCKFVTAWRDAGYRMYNSGAGNCSSKNDASGSNKSWKKIGYVEKLPPLPTFKPIKLPPFKPLKPPPIPTLPTFGGRFPRPVRPKLPSPPPPPPPPPPAKKGPWDGKKRFHEDLCDKVDPSLHGHEIFANSGVEKGTTLAGHWQTYGYCQPDPKNSSAGRELQVKMVAPTEKNSGIDPKTRMLAKCPLALKWKHGCTQECMYSSHPAEFTPQAWHGWDADKDGYGREMTGRVVTKHQVKYPAVGAGVRKCCQKLGCPLDCEDPKIGGMLYKHRATITKYNHHKGLWDMFKGKYTLKKDTGAKACKGGKYI